MRVGTPAAVALALALAGASDVAPAPPKPEADQSLEVTQVEPVDTVVVSLRVSAPAAGLTIAYCEELPSGRLGPCVSWFEIQKRRGWAALDLRPDCGCVTGVAPRAQWKTRVLPPHGSVELQVTLDKHELVARRGDRLRVVIEAWSDEGAMTSAASPIRLVSRPFTCP